MTQIIDNQTSKYSDPQTYKARDQGLYLLLVYNDSEHPVFDRNGDPGMQLVQPHAYMLKSGKFEGGLAARMHQNHYHFHRITPSGEKEHGIFPSMLRLLLVHSVSNERQLRPLETALNRAVRKFLADRHLDDPSQPYARAESRWIRGNHPPSPVDLETLFKGVLQST